MRITSDRRTDKRTDSVIAYTALVCDTSRGTTIGKSRKQKQWTSLVETMVH